MLGPWEGRPNLVIDKPSRSSVTVSVFWGSVSCLREGGNKAHFNPRQGEGR